MRFVRTVVFPGLRLVLLAVIAVALCVLAFGRESTEVSAGDPLQAAADGAQRTVEVSPTDISSSIELSGTVAADPGAAVRSTVAGVVTRVHRAVGDAVQVGAPLLDVRVTEEPTGPATVTAPDGAVTSGPPRTRTVTARAATAGTVSGVAVLKDQEVSVGMEVVTVSPGTLSVTAPLSQSEQFRLLVPPATAAAQARGGPAPFVCGGLSTAAATGAAGPAAIDPYTGQPGEASTAQVSCRVPPGTTVFAGMSVDLTIDAGSARQVLAVPVSAVLGTVSNGSVWVVDADGAPVERPVGLGLTDGQFVQVTSGLAAGDQVLEFTLVPSDDDLGQGGPGVYGS